MPGRQFSADAYRYGFNGQEKDDEIKGSGNSIDFGERIYDPRVGRFLSIDPLAKQFPFYSPYQFAGNSPIAAIDLDGRESFVVTKNRQANALIIQLVNAEDAFSVTWSKQDEGTKTSPMQITETQKFLSSVRVDPKTKTIRFDEDGTQYQYTTPGAERDGIGGKKEIAKHLTGPFNLSNGFIYSPERGTVASNEEILNAMQVGTENLDLSYERVDVFIDPSLRDQFTERFSAMGEEQAKFVKDGKLNFVDKPSNEGAQLEIIYKKDKINVEDIE